MGQSILDKHDCGIHVLIRTKFAETGYFVFQLLILEVNYLREAPYHRLKYVFRHVILRRVGKKIQLKYIDWPVALWISKAGDWLTWVLGSPLYIDDRLRIHNQRNIPPFRKKKNSERIRNWEPTPTTATTIQSTTLTSDQMLASHMRSQIWGHGRGGGSRHGRVVPNLKLKIEASSHRSWVTTTKTTKSTTATTDLSSLQDSHCCCGGGGHGRVPNLRGESMSVGIRCDSTINDWSTDRVEAESEWDLCCDAIRRVQFGSLNHLPMTSETEAAHFVEVFGLRSRK